MNVKEIISAIKKRPEMYLGDTPNLSNLSYYLNGFLASNIINCDERIDKLFKQKFHDWIRLYLERELKISIEEQSRNYQYYIKKVCNNERECLDLFFKTTEIFFNELKE